MRNIHSGTDMALLWSACMYICHIWLVYVLFLYFWEPCTCLVALSIKRPFLSCLSHTMLLSTRVKRTCMALFTIQSIPFFFKDWRCERERNRIIACLPYHWWNNNKTRRIRTTAATTTTISHLAVSEVGQILSSVKPSGWYSGSIFGKYTIFVSSVLKAIQSGIGIPRSDSPFEPKAFGHAGESCVIYSFYILFTHLYSYLYFVY